MSLASLPFENFRALSPDLKQIVLRLSRTESEERLEDLRAEGYLAVLNPLEYARALQDPHLKKEELELLYHSARTGAYIVAFQSLSARDALTDVLGEGVRITPNYRVSLQSLRSGPPAGQRDPREVLQWYSEDWERPGADRFPLSLDQRHPEIQLQKWDEMRFWLGEAGRLKPFTGSECLAHDPLTTRSIWLRDWLPREEASSVLRNSKGRPGLETGDTGLEEGFVILHDTLPDESHPELKGIVHRASSFGYHQGGDAIGDHGTHSAGVIAAARNQIGIAGVAPGAPIVAFGFPSESARGTPHASLRSLIPSLAEIKFFLDERRTLGFPAAGPQIIQLAYSAEVESARDALALEVVLSDLLAAHDVLVVVPAGNRSLPVHVHPSVFVPSELSESLNAKGLRGALLPIGASDVCSRPAWFSNRVTVAQGRSLYAPGQSIYSTLSHDDYGYISGTSAAASLVTGVAFALGHRGPESPQVQRGPSDSTELLRMLLRTSADLRVGTANHLVDAYALVDALARREGLGSVNNARAQPWGQAQ